MRSSLYTVLSLLTFNSFAYNLELLNQVKNVQEIKLNGNCQYTLDGEKQGFTNVNILKDVDVT